MAALKIYSKSGKERHFIALVDEINALVEQLVAEEQQQDERTDPAEDDVHRQQHADHSNDNKPHCDDDNNQSRQDAFTSTLNPPATQSTGRSQRTGQAGAGHHP